MNSAPKLPALPLGIQTFRILRKEGKMYVDKTALVKKLIDSYQRVFLSRPRRFGKSLLLSTLESYFLGEAELFKGLSLSPEEVPARIPVIRIDLSSLSGEGDLNSALVARIRHAAKSYAITIPPLSAPESLAYLIQELGAEKGCAVLVDEYDKPITEALTSHSATLDHNVATLRHFYSVLKSEDHLLKFVFLTGVSRFSKVSIFSGINNLKDISFLPEFASLCGYTKKELLTQCPLWVTSTAEALSMSEEGFLSLLQEKYNGYRFTTSEDKVFNPFSILNCFSDREARNYWFETATPTFLIRRVQEEKLEPQTLDSYEGVEFGMEPASASEVSTIDLLYQTGYLTIKDIYRGEKRTFYTLGWPNREVKDSFYESLIKEYSEQKLGGETFLSLSDALTQGKVKEFFEAFNVLLSSIPYSLFTNKESYYHSLLHMCLQVSGLVVHSEKLTSLGRIDLVCETKKYLYVIECKLDTPVDEAITQGVEKEYIKQYLRDERTPILLGVSFSSESRSVKEWKELKA